MDFGLNETEEMVKAAAREFLSQQAGPDAARDSTSTAAFWSQVCEMGWPGLAIAEEYGGAEMGLTALGVLMEQWGAFLASGPLFESAVLAAPLLESHADEKLKREVLPQIADGSTSVTVAVIEESASWRPEDVRATAVRADDSWAITGKKHFVSYGNEADMIIIAARTGAGTEDISLFLVDRDAEGVTCEQLGHASGSPAAVLTLNEVTVPSSRLIGAENTGWGAVEQMLLHGAAFRAVQMAGLGRRVLEITTSYVKERKQFGVPVGSFQAIQHHLADMAVAVREVEHMARRAAWSLVEGSETIRKDVSRAKQAGSSLIPQVCWTAHQCHGAIGFTEEHDLHLYTRRAVSWAAEFGDASWHADRLADALEI
jgi:alkylation response protein AidB-like acyl-CoA dehydrogenase